MIATFRARLVGLSVSAGLLALTACPRPGDAGTEPAESTEPTELTTGRDTADTDPPPTLEGICGTAGLRFADLAWIPSDARLATSLSLDDDDALGAAVAQLATLAGDPESTLPLVAAMDYRQLGLQLGSVRPTLEVLGSAPAELVEILGPDNQLVWAWPSDCPADQVSARLLARWQLVPRAELEHPGVRVAPSSDRFPFDLVTIGERHILLTRGGQGRAVAKWLGDSDDSPDTAPASALADLEAAPIRSVLVGEWLLTGTAGSGPAAVRTIRVTATEVELDAKPWPTP